jgi:uncharacterized repeat protein (TIGR03809 family)
MSENITGKWRELAEKRRAHFAELYDTGRWKHYYSENEFVEHMREAVRLSEAWCKIAPAPQMTPAE